MSVVIGTLTQVESLLLLLVDILVLKHFLVVVSSRLGVEALIIIREISNVNL